MTKEILRVASDIGGTFTDVALIYPDGRMATRKVPSTPANYSLGVVDGIMQLIEAESLAPSEIFEILNAGTVASNAILESKGARTALITTKGFRDVLELRRIRVPRLYEPLYETPTILVPRRLRYEVVERLDATGAVVTPIDLKSLDRVIEAIGSEKIEAVAVCFLHSYANPEHELVVGKRIREAFPDIFLSLSCEILPEIREYERTSTTVINSMVGPPVRAYLESLVQALDERALPPRVMVMQSAGGVVDVQTVMKRPAQIVECGPAAGVIGARHLGQQAGYKNLISFDMGGTTAKASLIEDGSLLYTAEYEVGGGLNSSSRLLKGGGYALKLPVIDIAEVGAGGGSIVWIDKGGSLKVGPHSAGAVPGPACYGRGGTEPTVTDSNVVLGYLNATSLAGGSVPITGILSERAIVEKLAGPLKLETLSVAWGIHEIVTTVMARAVKSVTTYRGRDPRDFSIFAFGGNGGIFGASLARALGISQVFVPPGGGVFSAVGLLFADIEMNASHSCLADSGSVDLADIDSKFKEMEKNLTRDLNRPSQVVRSMRFADFRYRGQAYEITVPFSAEVSDQAVRDSVEQFELAHERTNGYRLNQKRIDIVTLRVTCSVDSLGPKQLSRAKMEVDAEARKSRAAYFGPDFGTLDTPVIRRWDLVGDARQGPLIVEEYEGTTVVPPDYRARLDDAGNIVLTLV